MRYQRIIHSCGHGAVRKLFGNDPERWAVDQKALEASACRDCQADAGARPEYHGKTTGLIIHEETDMFDAPDSSTRSTQLRLFS